MAYVTDPVAELYRRTGVKPPTPLRPITPMGELIGSFNLMQLELADLTQKLVTSYLASNSAPVSQLDVSNDDPLAGFLYATRRQAIIFVRNTDPITRRRFSAAHELGHYWLHYVLQKPPGGVEDTPIIFVDAAPQNEMEETEEIDVSAKDKANLSQYEQREYEADLFAARLLMPTKLIQAKVELYKPGFEGENLVRRLASELLVSHQAIRIRLRELGLFSHK